MARHTFSVPVSLGVPRILGICRDLHSLPDGEEYELDFSATQHFEPFGMLMVASAIRRLAEREIDSGKKATVIITGKDLSKQGHDYARRLGFWWSIGDDSDLPSVMKTASNATIPITRLSYAELYKQAGGRDPIRAEVVTRAAADLATTLSGSPDPGPLWQALEYCFREMIRNGFEHGRTDSVWYTGATRPNKDDVQIAIVDAGQGIRASLSDNPDQRHSTDLGAIKAALLPGISRNTHKTRGRELTEKLLDQFPGQDPSRYDNSGYGLTLTSQLAREAGLFSIISGSACVAYVNGREMNSESRHVGTAVRIVLYRSRVEGVLERVFLKPDGTPRSGSVLTASMMTRIGLTPKRSGKPDAR